MKIDKNLTEEEKHELDLKLRSMDNPYDFENYCNACDYFCTIECPFGVIDPDTLWKKEDGGLGCEKFFD